MNAPKRTPREIEIRLFAKIKELKGRGIKCYLCGGEFGLGENAPTRDHVRAKSDRGVYVRTGVRGEHKSNLRWCHEKCNVEKKNLPLLQYQLNKLMPNETIKNTTLRGIRPTSTQYYWIESSFDIFLGPFQNQEEAIEVAKEWNSGNPQCCSNHDDIFLVYSREHPEHGWVWDYVDPKQNLTSCKE